MLGWLGGALGGVGNKMGSLLADPNFLKYMGGAGSKFGQGMSAGQALDPSAMISGQQEQQAVNQIMQGASGMLGGGGGAVEVAPSGQKMLPAEMASKLGEVLGGTVSAVADTGAPVIEARTGAVSPVIQNTPQATNDEVGDILGLVQQLSGGMGGMAGGSPGMVGGSQAPPPVGLEGSVGGGGSLINGRESGGSEGLIPTPIGSAGPDSITTKQTADGTTTTTQIPSERNLNTFGTNTPPEALIKSTTGGPSGEMLPLWKALLGM